MANGFAAEQAQSAASMEATRLHRRLGIAFNGPVDVLSIARDLGLVLMLQPLDSLLGFYVRGDEVSGVVINSQVPESLQRFTLAHEIGHHVLGHEGTADDEHAMGRFDSTSVVELAAQAFAASLLMPLPLVNSVLRDLPATRESRPLQPSDAYLFSRQVGVSYTAGVWALYRRQHLSLSAARAFIKRGSLVAKNAVRGKERVSDARAHVWTLTAENNDLSVMCRVGDEIHVELPEDTSNGLAWLIRAPSAGGLFDAVQDLQLTWSGDDIRLEEPVTERLLSNDGAGAVSADAIEIVEDEHVGALEVVGVEPGQRGLFSDRQDLAARNFPSGDGFRSLTFVPREEGNSQVVLELTRPWDAEAAVVGRYELDLHVRPKRLAGQGLLVPTADAWVDEHVASA